MCEYVRAWGHYQLKIKIPDIAIGAHFQTRS